MWFKKCDKNEVPVITHEQQQAILSPAAMIVAN
jgi:hypothetical protein